MTRERELARPASRRPAEVDEPGRGREAAFEIRPGKRTLVETEALPFSAEIQRSFGRHDLSTVRAAIGGAAGDEAARMDARAFTLGDLVAFRGAPDLHLAAHEAAHVIQQRAGAARADDPDLERHADLVADAVVAGRSAEGLLDRFGGTRSGVAPVVQRKAANAPTAAEEDARVAAIGPWVLARHVDAPSYYKLHSPAFVETMRARLAPLSFDLVPGVSWTNGSSPFIDIVCDAVSAHDTTEVPLLLQPEDPWRVIDDARELDPAQPVVRRTGPTWWQAAAAIRIASALELGLRSSLARMAPRLAAAGAHAQATSLVTSCLLDRVVGAVLRYPGVTVVTAAAARPEAPPRAVSVSWGNGADDWNWVTADPRDATPEEVSLALWQTTDFATRLERVGDIFEVPQDLARATRGPGYGDATPDPHRAIAQKLLDSWLGNSAALAEGPPSDAKLTRADAIDAVDATSSQITEIAEIIAPAFSQVPVLAPMQRWLETRSAGIAKASETDIAAWAPILVAQTVKVIAANDALQTILRAAKDHVVPVDLPETHPVQRLLQGIVDVVLTSYLAKTGQRHLDQLAALVRTLAIDNLEWTTHARRDQLQGVRAMDADELHPADQTDTADLMARLADLRAAAAAHRDVDASALDRATVETESFDVAVDLRSRLAIVDAHLERIDRANRSLLAGQTARDARQALIEARGRLASAELELLADARTMAERQARLDRARAAIADVDEASTIEDADDAASSVEHRQLGAQGVEMLAITVATDGLGAAAGEALGVGFDALRAADSIEAAAAIARTGRRVATATKFIAAPALNAAAQSMLDGTSFGRAFVDGLASQVVTTAALGPLHDALGIATTREAETAAAFDSAAEKWLARSSKLATGTAVGVVVPTVVQDVHQLAAGEPLAPLGAQQLVPNLIAAALGHALAPGIQASIERLGRLGRAAGDLLVRCTGQLAATIDLVRTRDPALALSLWRDRLQALGQEAAIWRALADDPEALAARGLSREIPQRNAARAVAQAKAIPIRVGRLPFELAGAVPEGSFGRRWAGTADQLVNAIRYAREAGVAVSLATRGDHEWHVEYDGDAIVLRERDPAPRSNERVTAELVDGDTERLQNLRKGKPGTVRSEKQLASGDVADVMNGELQRVSPNDVAAMLDGLSPELQARARHVLARATGFARIESFNALREAIAPYLAGGARLLVLGVGSLADNLAYLAGKHTFPGHPDPIQIATTPEAGCVVILDDVAIARMRADRAFANALVATKAVLVQPRGFVDGINLFGSPSTEAIRQRMWTLAAGAQAYLAANPSLSFDDALDVVLDQSATTALTAAESRAARPAPCRGPGTRGWRRHRN